MHCLDRGSEFEIFLAGNFQGHAGLFQILGLRSTDGNSVAACMDGAMAFGIDQTQLPGLKGEFDPFGFSRQEMYPLHPLQAEAGRADPMQRCLGPCIPRTNPAPSRAVR